MAWYRSYPVSAPSSLPMLLTAEAAGLVIVKRGADQFRGDGLLLAGASPAKLPTQVASIDGVLPAAPSRGIVVYGGH